MRARIIAVARVGVVVAGIGFVMVAAIAIGICIDLGVVRVW